MSGCFRYSGNSWIVFQFCLFYYNRKFSFSILKFLSRATLLPERPPLLFKINLTARYPLGNQYNNDHFEKCYSDCIYVAIPYQGFVRKARIFQFTFCGRQFIKKDRWMVYKLLTFITDRLKPWIIESMHGLNQSSKQDDQSFISILDYPWPVGSN